MRRSRVDGKNRALSTNLVKGSPSPLWPGSPAHEVRHHAPRREVVIHVPHGPIQETKRVSHSAGGDTHGLGRPIEGFDALQHGLKGIHFSGNRIHGARDRLHLRRHEVHIIEHRPDSNRESLNFLGHVVNIMAKTLDEKEPTGREHNEGDERRVDPISHRLELSARFRVKRSIHSAAM